MTPHPINQQFGDYIITSKVENVPPFSVRRAGRTNGFILSVHWNIVDAINQIRSYQTTDKQLYGPSSQFSVNQPPPDDHDDAFWDKLAENFAEWF
jgi:hypothetical protein